MSRPLRAARLRGLSALLATSFVAYLSLATSCVMGSVDAEVTRDLEASSDASTSAQQIIAIIRGGGSASAWEFFTTPPAVVQITSLFTQSDVISGADGPVLNIDGSVPGRVRVTCPGWCPELLLNVEVPSTSNVQLTARTTIESGACGGDLGVQSAELVAIDQR